MTNERPVHVLAAAPLRRLIISSIVVLAGVATAVSMTFAPIVTAQSVSLRALADDAGLALGAAVDADALSDESYRELLTEHVTLVSTSGDLSMATVQPERGVFDFTRAEAIVDFAVENGLTVRGHELIGGDVPGWVRDGDWTPETLSEVLRDHVTAVVGHFRERNPGVITQWDVVGEAFLPDGTLRPTVWQQIIGDDHLRTAFAAADAADPEALLFYDDFYDDLAVTQDAVAAGVPIVPGANASRSTCELVPKCVGVRDRTAALVAADTPIDGIGFQSHLFSPDPADFSELSAWVTDLGLQWGVTEFDVPLPVTEIDSAEALEFQATVYADALTACADAPDCTSFVTWGISDRFSPIPAETGGAFGGALWFDADDEPKPAFAAMADALADRATPATPTTSTASVAGRSSTSPQDTTSGNGDGGGDSVLMVVGLGGLAVVATLVVVARRRRGGHVASSDS